MPLIELFVCDLNCFNYSFLICEKNFLCDCSKSNYVIAVQLTQDMSRGWMIIHAKFLKFSSNISEAILA